MSVSRLVCAAAALSALVGGLWIPTTPTAACETPTAAAVASPAAVPAAAIAPVTAAPFADPFEPVARVSSLMWGLGSAMGQLNEVFPKTDDENRLHAISSWSEVVAELSNVHTRHTRKSEGYLEMAGRTGAIALDLARAARAGSPDEDRLAALLTQLDTSCATCHEADH